MDSIGGSVASSLISREPARAVVSTIPLALHESAVVQVFGRRNDETDHTLVRPATNSAKARSRGVLRTGWQRGLWGT
jgi:hypothetical protein